MFYKLFVVAAIALAFAGVAVICLDTPAHAAEAKSKYTITLTPEEARICEDQGGCAYVSGQALHQMLLAEVQAYFNSGGPNFTCTKNTAEIGS